MAETESIWSALLARDSDGVRRALAAGADVNECGKGEYQPIHMACELDAADCVRALVDGGADVAAEDGQLRTPLLVACENASFAAAELVIQRDVSCGPLWRTSSTHAADRTGRTALHWFAFHGHCELAKLALSRGASIDALNEEHETPLSLAVHSDKAAVAAQLGGAGADLKVVNDQRRTVLHLAMSHGASQLEVLRLVLQRQGRGACGVDARDKERRTALHLAASQDAVACVEALLGAGADANVADWAEQTPLQWACSFDALASAQVRPLARRPLPPRVRPP